MWSKMKFFQTALQSLRT